MGTRFRLFVQPPYAEDASEPEIIEVSSPAGSIGPGPSDGAIYVLEPHGKQRAYGLNSGPFGTPFLYLPPWRGQVLRPAMPDADGHFDHYHPGDPEFAAAHAFGCVRFTLDVWGRYLGQPLQWHFRDHYDRLEISILPEWDNAQYGYGFLELGSQSDEGRSLPFALDFDVIAHEVGHAIIYGVMGVPAKGRELPEYVGFQEAFADCVSLIAAMHFPSAIEGVLEGTRGNLHRSNRLSRFSESSATRQIRSADNIATMADFVRGFRDEHQLSQPLTGAIFDILVDVFHDNLVENGAIPVALDRMADAAEDDERLREALQNGFDVAFARCPDLFVEALLDARDVMGQLLAETLWELGPDYLDYGDVARTMADIDAAHGGELSGILRWNFGRRFIGKLHAGRRVGKRNSHADKRVRRSLQPSDVSRFPKMPYREGYDLMRAI